MRPAPWLWLAVSGLVGLTVSACETASTTPPEAQIPEWDGTVEVTPPTPPELPNWSGSCPDGWRPATSEDGAGWCEPWPEDGPLECADDEAHFPGEPGCRRIGAECPAGDWPDDLGDDGVLYVKANARAGGAGTRSAPFATIAEAMARARPRTTIALSKGVFTEPVVLAEGVTLRGACVAGTVLDCPEAGSFAILTQHASTTARDLMITGSCGGVMADDPGTSLDLEGVVIARTAVFGLAAQEGARLTGRDVVVQDPQRNEDVDGTLGVLATETASLSLSHVVIEGIDGMGVAVSDEAAITLTDTVVHDITGIMGNAAGGGLYADSRGRIEASRLVVGRSRVPAIMLVGAGSSLEARDIVVRDIQVSSEEHLNGGGIWVLERGQALVQRALLEGLESNVIVASNPDTRIELTDIIIRHARSPVGVATLTMGLLTYRGARGDARRVLIEHVGGYGAACGEDGAALSLTDITIRDAEDPVRVDDTWGLAVFNRAAVDVTRASIERNRHGVIATGLGATLTMVDVVVRDSAVSRCPDAPCSGPYIGAGIASADGALLTVERFRSTGNALCGVMVMYGWIDDGEGGMRELENPGMMDLHDGEVSQNRVCGANLQVEGYDLTRLTDRVIYHDNNGRNLDAVENQVSVPDLEIWE